MGAAEGTGGADLPLWGALIDGLTHPALLLAGGALVLVPWAIHWWNRRRVRSVEWGAMRLLVHAQRRDQRRVRLEDRGLLVLRMVAVIGLGLLVARPYLRARDGVAGDGGVEFIVLVDDSLSMQTVDSEGSALDRVRRLLGELVDTRVVEGRDFLTLLRATDPSAPLLDRVPLDERREADLRMAVERLTATDAVLDWREVLAEFRRWLDERPSGARRVVVCSDFRRVDWLPEGEQDTTRSGPELPRDEAWLLCDVAGEATANLQLLSLEPDGVVAPGVPVSYVVTLRNASPVAAQEIELRLTAADTPPLRITVDTLAAGATTSVAFPFQMAAPSAAGTPGGLEVRAELSSAAPERNNRLLADDTMFEALVPTAGVPVVLLTAARDATEEEEEWLYLQQALAPGGGDTSASELTRNGLAGGAGETVFGDGTPTGVVPRVVRADEWDTVAWSDTRVAFVLGGAVLPPAERQRLAHWVSQGGSLVLSPGEVARTAEWNDAWFADGTGLAPAALVQIHGSNERADWVHWQEVDPGFAPAKLLSGDGNPFAGRIKVFRWWEWRELEAAAVVESARGTGPERARGLVRARLSDPLRSPMLVEKAYGDGRVLMLAAPFDARWTDWPADPSFLVFVQELVRELAPDPRRPTRVTVGDAIRCRVEMSRVLPQAWVRTPDRQRWPVTGEVLGEDELAGRGPTEWRFISPPTSRAGIYTLEWSTPEGQRIEHAVAAVPSPREGDLRRVPPEWQTENGDRGPRRIPSQQVGEFAVGERREQWRWVVWLLGGLLVAEQGWAWQTGRRR